MEYKFMIVKFPEQKNTPLTYDFISSRWMVDMTKCYWPKVTSELQKLRSSHADPTDKRYSYEIWDMVVIALKGERIVFNSALKLVFLYLLKNVSLISACIKKLLS